jgi:hypothetical protein
MPVTQAVPFQCPTCGAEYKLVRVETKETCRKCGGPLPGSEGHLIPKYFLVDRGRRRASGALPRKIALKRQSHERAHLRTTGGSSSKKKAPRERGQGDNYEEETY